MGKPKKKYAELSIIEKNYIKKKLEVKHFDIKEIDIAILKQLKENLKQLKDIRTKGKILFKIWDVVMCVVLSSFANNNTWEEIHDFVRDNYNWFKSFLQMTGGIPKASSYERIMGFVNKDELNNILFDFFNSITFQKNPEIEIESYDGRVNKGSGKKTTLYNEKKFPLNCLNGYSNKFEYCISTTEISDKSNEIPTIEKVLKGRNLTNIIITFDALNTQTKNIETIVNAGGDYVVPIKGNHGTFYQDLIDYFDDDTCDKIRAGNLSSQYKTYIEKNHSSIIKYELFQTSDIIWYDRLNEWKNIKSFGLVKKTITKKDKVKVTCKNNKEKYIEKEITTIENRYYISSRQVNIDEFGLATRSHWNIENKIHWHLDYTFAQDKNTTSNKNALLNLEIVHKFVLACLNRVKDRYDMSMIRIRKHLSRNFEEFLPELICYMLIS